MGDIEKTEITKRLNEALKTAFLRKGIMLKSEMADTLGYKSPYFSGVTTGKEKLTGSFLTTLKNVAGINPDWVLTGEGEMLNDADDDVKSKQCVIPLVPVSAHGGSLSTFAEQVRLSDCEKIISPVRGVDMAVTVSGDSMAPEYPNGSIVMVKKIDGSKFIEWGKAHVLDTRNGVIIKLLAPGKTNDNILCVSVNKDPIYAPFEVAREDIFGIYQVKFSMTRR